LRRRARTCELAVETVPSQLVDPEIAAQHQLDLEVIDEVARAKLASEDLEVILGGLNGESSDELAERLGATPGAVRVRRHRAFRTLRGELRRLLNLGEAA
jgi:DNA-directed RNA polymerase specialized sigma24 family protein